MLEHYTILPVKAKSHKKEGEPKKKSHKLGENTAKDTSDKGLLPKICKAFLRLKN